MALQTADYAMNCSGWISLDIVEDMYKQAKSRVYNEKKGEKLDRVIIAKCRKINMKVTSSRIETGAKSEMDSIVGGFKGNSPRPRQTE